MHVTVFFLSLITEVTLKNAHGLTNKLGML